MNRQISYVVIVMLLSVCMTTHVVAAGKSPEQIVKEAKATIREVSTGDVKKMLDAKEKFILLDVRDRHEFVEGYISGAINISRGTLEFKAAMIIPDKGARIVVYCAQDLRGPLAAKTLNDLGYSNTVNMIGGLNEWKSAGYPVTNQP